MTADPMQRARERVQRYVDMRDQMPMRQLGDSVHGIHSGTEWEAELLLSDLRALLTREEEVRGEGWQSIETAPDDEPFMAGLWVSNNKTGQRWWEAYLVSIDDETGEAKYWPDGELLPWTLQDFDAWHSIPAPPAIRSANCGGGA